MRALTFVTILVFCGQSPAAAQGPGEMASTNRPLAANTSWAALEANVLWPFFPGGFTDVKLLLPAFGHGEQRGEVVIGLFSDFSWRARPKDAGKVGFLAVKLGYRQFLWSGLHLEAVFNNGWRQERDNPHDGTTLNGFAVQFWSFAGYQMDLSKQWYANSRVGVGSRVWRSDRFGDRGQRWIPVADINFGLRF